MKRRTLLRAAVAAAVSPPFTFSAYAQTWPIKAIKWVNPFPAGGGTDVLVGQDAEEWVAPEIQAVKPPIGRIFIIEEWPLLPCYAANLIYDHYVAEAEISRSAADHGTHRREPPRNELIVGVQDGQPIEPGRSDQLI